MSGHKFINILLLPLLRLNKQQQQHRQLWHFRNCVQFYYTHVHKHYFIALVIVYKLVISLSLAVLSQMDYDCAMIRRVAS